MTDYNVALRVSYNGTEVSRGAARNKKDMDGLVSKTVQQGNASRKTSVDLQSLNASNRQIAGSSVNSARYLKSLNVSVAQLGAQSTASAATATALVSAVDRQGNEAVITNQRLRELTQTIVRQGVASNAAASQQQRLAGTTIAQGKASQTAAAQNRGLTSSYLGMAGAMSGLAVFGLGTSLIKSAESSELLTIRIRNLSGSMERAEEVESYLATTADTLNTRYSTLAGSYARLIVLENQKTLSQTESRNVLEGMVNVAKTLGATNVQVEQSMYGLTQALTQGTVQAQELNQVTEPLPGLLQSLDKAAGLPANGFRNLVKEGKVTSEFLKTTLIEAFKDFDGAAEANATTISASFANLGSQYDLLVKKLEAPINAAVRPVIDTLSRGIKALGADITILDDIAFAAGVVATVFAGRVVGSLATATQAKVKLISATQAALVAERNAAAVAIGAAKARAAQTLSTNAVTAATVRYTAAAQAATISTRVLSGSMAFLGGPLGAITIGAIALGFFVSSAFSAVDAADSLTDSTRKLHTEQSKLNPFKNYTKTQAESALARYEVMLERSVEMAEEARIRASNSDSKVDIFQLNEANERVDALTTKIQFAKAQLTKFADAPPGADTGGQETKVDYTAQLANLRFSLLSEEQQITASYEKRQAILDGYLSQNIEFQQEHQSLSKALFGQKESEVLELKAKSEQEQLDLAKARRDEEQRELEIEYENKLATIQGFYDRKALIEYQQNERILNAKADQEVLAAEGFANQAEKDAHTREQKVFDATYKRAGVMKQFLFTKAEWERKNEFEKTESVLDIGEYGFKQMAGQSKKAFALYKAFSIAKAVMNTYEMATGAFNALAPIPIVGPALGTAAAAAAIAFGLNQVNTIKNQQYSAAYHGGRDYIPSEQTALLQQGERVVSPRQNVALTKAVDIINDGNVAGNGGVNITYSPHIVVEGGSEGAFERANEMEKQMYERFEGRLINQLRSRTGGVYNAMRSAA